MGRRQFGRRWLVDFLSESAATLHRIESLGIHNNALATSPLRDRRGHGRYLAADSHLCRRFMDRRFL